MQKKISNLTRAVFEVPHPKFDSLIAASLAKKQRRAQPSFLGPYPGTLKAARFLHDCSEITPQGVPLVDTACPLVTSSGLPSGLSQEGRWEVCNYYKHVSRYTPK